MKKNKISINIISSFNHSNLVGLLKNNKSYDFEINEVDYNQVFQVLSNPKNKMWKKKSNISLVWVNPEDIFPEFNKLIFNEKINCNILKEQVISFCSHLKSIKKNSDFILIPSLILKQPIESNIALGYSKNRGLDYNLSLINHILSEQLDEKKFYLLNSNKWLSNCGIKNAYSSKLWYLTKCPFSNDFFKEAISDILNFYNSSLGLAKKLLILDLDDTIWGGIVGEVGWKKLRIGGHDYLGEAFQDFQSRIKSLKNHGILLAIASKNEESNAIEAIKKHPEMNLTIDDFVAYKINWNDKAKNIAEMVKELNLGLQSVVFLDDSPFERERVREMLPEVYVPDLPKDPTEYSNFLSKLRCFDPTHVTEEDKTRSDLYKSEFKRKKLKQNNKSLSKWIETLGLEIIIENINNKNSPRALQLLNKTNQMNLSTRRMTENEFQKWIQKKTNYLWTVRAKDKFGDYGIIGILSMAIKEKDAYLVDFVLSCRVVGRFIEETIIQFLKDFCHKKNIKKINGTYIKTQKNTLCYQFLQKLKILKKNKKTFTLLPNKEKINIPNIKIIKPKILEKANVS